MGRACAFRRRRTWSCSRRPRPHHGGLAASDARRGSAWRPGQRDARGATDDGADGARVLRAGPSCESSLRSVRLQRHPSSRIDRCSKRRQGAVGSASFDGQPRLRRSRATRRPLQRRFSGPRSSINSRRLVSGDSPRSARGSSAWTAASSPRTDRRSAIRGRASSRRRTSGPRSVSAARCGNRATASRSRFGRNVLSMTSRCGDRRDRDPRAASPPPAGRPSLGRPAGLRRSAQALHHAEHGRSARPGSSIGACRARHGPGLRAVWTRTSGVTRTRAGTRDVRVGSAPVRSPTSACLRRTAPGPRSCSSRVSTTRRRSPVHASRSSGRRIRRCGGKHRADGVAIAPALPLPSAAHAIPRSSSPREGRRPRVRVSDWRATALVAAGDIYLTLWTALRSLRGSVFTDRGVYKQGDAVRVKAVLRADDAGRREWWRRTPS